MGKKSKNINKIMKKNNEKMKEGLSDMAKTENIRLSTLSPNQIVKDYDNFEELPTNKEIIIDKIAVINWNPHTRSNISIGIKYKLFTELDPEKYPIGKNPQVDYMPDEEVSPVIIIDISGKKYKTDMIFWFPLIDVHDGIIFKQSITGERIFPQKIFIDKNSNDENGNVKNIWVSKLLRLVGHDIISNLGNQN